MGAYADKYFQEIERENQRLDDSRTYSRGTPPEKATKSDFLNALKRQRWTVSEACTLLLGYRLDSYHAQLGESLDREEFIDGFVQREHDDYLSARSNLFSAIENVFEYTHTNGPRSLVSFMGESQLYAQNQEKNWHEIMSGLEFPVLAFYRFAKDILLPKCALDAPCFGLFQNMDAIAEEMKRTGQDVCIIEPLDPEFAEILERSLPSLPDGEFSSLEASSLYEEDATLLTAEDETLGEQAPSFDMEPCAASASSEDKSPGAHTDYSFSHWFDGERSPLEWILRTIEEWASRPEYRRTDVTLRDALDRAAKNNGQKDGLQGVQIRAINAIVLPQVSEVGRGKKRRFRLPEKKK